MTQALQERARPIGVLFGLAQKARSTFGAFAALGLLAGCSTHPVQRDVTQIPSRDIVVHIRCEAREAVFKKALVQLEYGAQRAERTHDFNLAQRYRSLSLSLRQRWSGDSKFNFSPGELPTSESKVFYRKYIETAIAFDFLMQGIETNIGGLAADPVRLISGGTLGLTIGGSGTLTRDNSRHFRLTDTFKELLELPKDICLTFRPKNYVYPISGQVGLDEVIATFIDVNEVDQLDKKSKDDGEVFADTMRFTTTFTGGLTPHIEIAPAGSTVGLTPPATVNFSASRTDVHTLIVGLAMGEPKTVRSIGFSLSGSVVKSGASTNKEAAHQAIDGIIQRNFYENFRPLLR